MANIQSQQAFYALSLENSTAPHAAVVCNCIPSAKASDQQIVEARGQYLVLYRIKTQSGTDQVSVKKICEYNTFSTLRGVVAVRIPGTSVDSLVLSTDSGRVTLVQYDEKENNFEKQKIETFGKSGIRRTVPGQYIASDPRGRAFMLASTEKNKVAWIVQRRPDGEIQISSPHEALSWATLCSDICALDTGWEHPVFASLELDYSDLEATGVHDDTEMRLVYYTVDLSLNHVTKAWSEACLPTANKLFPVPGGQDGPSGVLVCGEGRIDYMHDKARSISIQIPRRRRGGEDPHKKPWIVAGATHLLRNKHDFFMLLQTDDGDVFKLTMTMETDSAGRKTSIPVEMRLKYFDTLPVAKQLLIIRKGFIYVSAESGDSRVYLVQDLGDDPSVEPFNTFSSENSPSDDSAWYFTPRGLRHLAHSTDVPSMHPLIRARVENLTGDDAPQIYTLQGTRNNSSLKTLRNGLDINTFVNTQLGSVPCDNLWPLRANASDEYQSFMILSSSYGDRTIVLKIDEEVEAVDDTEFVTNRATIGAWQMGEDTFVQAHMKGIRSIYSNGQSSDWKTAQASSVVAASGNRWQLVAALSTTDLCLFEMDDNGVLNELTSSETRPEMSGSVTALAVAPAVEGSSDGKFVAVGCDDCTIRILSISPDTHLEQLSIQAISAVPTSIEIVYQLDPNSDTQVLYIHIGLASGVYLRALIDEHGEIGDVRNKFLGTRPVRLFPVSTHGQTAVMACSSRSWLGYYHPATQQYTITPLVIDRLEAARNFETEHLQGLASIKGMDLDIFEITSLEQRVSTKSVQLDYTPKALSRSLEYPVFYVAQSDSNTPNKEVSARNEAAYSEQAMQNGVQDTQHSFYAHVEIEDELNDEEQLKAQLGLPRVREPGLWASCVQAIEPHGAGVASAYEFEAGEAALSTAVVQFAARNWESFLAVGTGKGMGTAKAIGFVHIFKLSDAGRTIEHLHATEFESPIYAILPYQGRLALGIGKELFIYDIGMKFLLRKSRGAAVPNQIISIAAQGPRLICADVSDSVTYVVFKPEHNRLVPFVDDTVQRWTTAISMIDYETTAGGDKFGNLWVVRCPDQASKEADEEGIGGYIHNERPYLNGAPYRLELRAHYYTQDIPMSIQRTELVPGGQEVLFWAGIQGTLGMLIPFVSRTDLDFFSNLESHLRAADLSMVGRDHLAYRSYYTPVKGIIDGDLCERFLTLSYNQKQKVAGEMDRPVKEIERKVQDMRTRVAF